MEWKQKTLKLKDLKENAKNPRRITKHDAEHLQRSITRFGVCEPLVVNTDNTIIGGHQRYRTLKKLGYKEVSVYVPDKMLDDKQADELTIRLNRNSGEFDYDILANKFEVDDLLDWGFSDNELDLNIEAIEGTEPDDEEIDPPKEAKSKLGDLYVLGNHRLLCGDSTNPDDVKKLLECGEPILMVTDPPYGVNYDPDWRGRAGKGQSASGKVMNDNKVNWSLAWVLFPGSVAYIWHAGCHGAEVQKSLEDAEFETKAQIIWAKQHFALSRGDYHWKHEPCWYAIKKGHEHNWQGSRKETTVWEISNLNSFGKSTNEDERTNHSTQKPLECMSTPIRNNSAEGELIYDPFVGSGITLIACEQLKRNAYCMELDPVYCDMVVTRWKNYMVKKGESYKIILNNKEISW